MTAKAQPDCPPVDLAATNAVRWPDFIVVGAPKCGTTTLYSYLRLHPDIFMPDIKEPHHYGSDLGGLIRDRQEYLDLFTQARSDQTVGEASPLYLYSKIAAQEIRDANPATKIVISLRQPVDFMYSFHTQQLQVMHCENLTDFEEALAAEPDRREGRRIPSDFEYPHNWLFYRDFATYTPQVRRYIDAFGRENVHFILFDDLVGKPQEEYSRLCRFLGVRDDVSIQPHNAYPAHRWRSRAFAHFLYRVPSPVLAAGRLFPKSVRRRLYNTLWRANEAMGYRKRLDPARRRELTAEFTPEIRQLGDLIGRDLSAWCEA
jgi:Sulfotransferase domain